MFLSRVGPQAAGARLPVWEAQGEAQPEGGPPGL